jgi:hypothetical protein
MESRRFVRSTYGKTTGTKRRIAKGIQQGNSEGSHGEELGKR